jgi:hypothetical protein
MAAHGTANDALLQRTRMSAADLVPRIRVNAIAAALIASSAMAPVLAVPARRSAMEQSSALRRFGVPEDVAAAVVFPESPATSYFNFQRRGAGPRWWPRPDRRESGLPRRVSECAVALITFTRRSSLARMEPAVAVQANVRGRACLAPTDSYDGARMT